MRISDWSSDVCSSDLGEERQEPRWIAKDVILAVHDRQLAEHGGGSGIRDAGLLESALARPIHRWNYGADDLTDLAEAYAYVIARNHPFVAGNKRTAWVAARPLFVMNQIELNFTICRPTGRDRVDKYV